MLKKAKLWEAARATSAATTFFEPIQIGGEWFVDGATGANCPIPEMWAEANDIWSDGGDWRLEDNVSCFVSIGTGVPPYGGFQDTILGISKTLTDIATDSQKAAEDFQRTRQYMYKQGRFFRFNVDQGLGHIGLEEAEMLDDIRSATRDYVQRERVRDELATCLKVLAQRESASIYA